MRVVHAKGVLDCTQPRVMGVLNVTPDSFSDGGRYEDADRAVAHGCAMAAQGAAIIDVGGESTRPGAPLVPVAEELRRVIPVIRRLAAETDVLVSIDTRRPEVMAAAVDAGAVFINDIAALQEPGALEVAAGSRAAVCLMHMQGEPATMQVAPQYVDVVKEVRAFLEHRLAACRSAGIARDRLLVDPGIGFGKKLEHNLALLAHIPQLTKLGLPVLVGVSRKSMIGTLLGRAVDERVPGGVALATAAVLAGASIIRTHDVPETLDAVRIAAELRAAGYADSMQQET